MAAKRILIGVDFGTTFTGIAWSDPSNETLEPYLLSDWPKLNSDKVPTILRYNVSDSIKGVAGFKWGNEVKASERRHEWFKLGLDPMQYKASTSVDLSVKYPNKLEEAPHYEKKARDLAVDYLTSVRKHAIKKIRDRYGGAAFDALKVEWIITVPAVWSPEAKNATRECAEAAGMGKGDSLRMTSEPEAAAIFALKRLEPHNIQVGNNIVVCDAGGGTVDLVTYRIKNVKPDLVVEESGICSGGKCGSVFLNRVFEHMVDRKLGGKTLSDDTMADMRKQWEFFTKREFDDEEEDNYFLPVPGAPDNAAARIKHNRIAVTPAEMKEIFDVVVDPVIELVKGQISGITGSASERNVSAIVLVGGFSECNYLVKRLKAEIETPTMPILKSPNAWTAVVRGAVMKGLKSQGVVASRKAQNAYGTSHSSIFRAGDHKEMYKYFDSFEGKFMARDCTSWFVRRGDTLPDEKAIEYEFYRIVPLTSNLIVEDEIYECFTNDAPDNLTENCKVLGVLRTNLSSVEKWRLDKVTGQNGKDCYRIDYTLLAKFGSADIQVSFKMKDKEYSSVRLDYANSTSPKRFF